MPDSPTPECDIDSIVLVCGKQRGRIIGGIWDQNGTVVGYNIVFENDKNIPGCPFIHSFPKNLVKAEDKNESKTKHL